MLIETKESASVAAAASAAAAPRREKLRLGDVLVQQGLISPEQLQQALDLQRGTGKRLGRLLIEAGVVTEEAVAHGLARQLRAPVVNLKSFPLKSETVRLLAESPARRHRVVVLEDKGEHLLVGFADPLDLVAYDELTRVLKRPVRIAVVPESQLSAVLDRHYRRSEEITGLAKALEKDVGDAVDFGTLEASVGQEGAPVVRLLQSVFEDALQAGASDVHLEPQEHGLLIRSRVDGVLQTQTQADKRIAAALSQRLKLMAGLDISEKRMPQDGRFTLRLKERQVDVRLSTLPSQYGESVVMRLLGQGDTVRRLDEIGMPQAMLARFKEVLGRSSGMVLVTGPTGSGKTTTLYAALAEIDAEQQKVITVEDPIEYRLPGLTQVQVNDKIELSFARVLRACLRQDPDVILVGEIRDAETADVGLRAAITGHLVLSSPRIATLNNQKAVLKVGTDEYFVTNVSGGSVSPVNNNNDGTTTLPTLTLTPFFSGIALDVTPQIDDANMITLHLRPSVTSVTEVTRQIDLGRIGSYKLPLASSSVNETDTVVRVPDGNIVAIGGLMQSDGNRSRSGLPGSGDNAVTRTLFGNSANTARKRELVVLIRPTIIRSAEDWQRSTEQALASMDQGPRRTVVVNAPAEPR